MRYRELIIQIERGQVQPVYLFHGEEGFLIEEAIARLKKAILIPGSEDLNYHLLSGSSTRIADIIHPCQTLPLLSTRRLVVVREAEALSGSEGLIPYLDNPSNMTCLVLVAGKLDLRKRLFLALKSRATEVLFSALNDSQTTLWMKEMARTLGIALSPEALDYLKERLGNDLYQIRNELEKISLTMTGNHTINAEDLQALLTGERGHSVFEWLDSVRSRDQEKAFRLLRLLLDSGEHPLSLLGLLLSSLRRAARSAHPGRQDSPAGPLSRHTGSSLESSEQVLIKSFALCLEADSRLKGSRLSPQLILEGLILDLCRIGENLQEVNIGPGQRRIRPGD